MIYPQLYEEQLLENSKLLERLRVNEKELQSSRETIDANEKKVRLEYSTWSNTPIEYAAKASPKISRFRFSAGGRNSVGRSLGRIFFGIQNFEHLLNDHCLGQNTTGPGSRNPGPGDDRANRDSRSHLKGLRLIRP